MRLIRWTLIRGEHKSESFHPPEEGQIVSVDWDDETVDVTWLVPTGNNG